MIDSHKIWPNLGNLTLFGMQIRDNDQSTSIQNINSRQVDAKGMKTFMFDGTIQANETIRS